MAAYNTYIVLCKILSQFNCDNKYLKIWYYNI